RETAIAIAAHGVTEYKRDGVAGAAVAALNTVNPLYQVAVTAIDTKEAAEKGDYRAAAEGATTVVLSVVSVVVGVRGALGKGGGSSGPKTLKPGPYAKDSIPARGPGRDFTKAERDAINEIGQTSGCHTCGTKDPGTKSGDFIPDHQPPTKLAPGTPQL